MTARTTIGRRGFLAGIAGLTVSPALAQSLDPATKHIAIGDLAAGLKRPGDGVLKLLYPKGSDANLAPVAKAFQDLTGIRIELVEAEVLGVATNLLLDRMLGENWCDVALPATFDIPDLVAGDALIAHDEFNHLGLPPFLDGDLLYSEGDSFEGRTYGFQTDGDSYFPFYNRNILEDPGIAGTYADRFGRAFSKPSSWEELDRQIVHVHGAGRDLGGGLLIRSPGFLEWEFWLRLLARGIWPMNDDLAPQIHGAEGVAVLEDMIRIAPYLTPDHGGDNALFDNWIEFEKNRSFMTMSRGGGQKYLQRRGGPLRGRISFGQMPGGEAPDTPDTLPNFNWGWSYAVVKGGTAPELAHLFCRFAVTPVISAMAVRRGNGFFDPFRLSHYEDTEIGRIYGPEFLEAHRVSMTGAIPDFYLADRSAYFSSLFAALSQTLAGRQDPARALAQAADEWDLISSEGDLGKQRRRWRQLREKYPADVALHLRDLST
jgi:multiple sugar transport system substrate-binding protein